MQTISIAGTELAYVDRGTGQALLLVHGFPLDHAMWSEQIGALAARYRVVAPDLRGFGKSLLGNIDPAQGVTMEQYADDLVALLDALAITEPVVFVGLSMGGYIGWQFVRKYSDRLRALIQCDTRALADTDEARAGRIKMAENVAEWGSGRVADMMGPKLFAPRTWQTNPQIVVSLRSVVESTSPAAIAAARRGMAARPDVSSMLGRIQVPTLVIVGEEDAISPPAEMKSIAAAIPGAEFLLVANSGHMTTMENPEAVNDAILRFLSRI